VADAALDGEVETPGIVHTRLPYIARDTVFLGTEGGVMEILKQERRLFVERSLNGCGGLAAAALKVRREIERHQV